MNRRYKWLQNPFRTISILQYKRFASANSILVEIIQLITGVDTAYVQLDVQWVFDPRNLRVYLHRAVFGQLSCITVLIRRIGGRGRAVNEAIWDVIKKLYDKW